MTKNNLIAEKKYRDTVASVTDDVERIKTAKKMSSIISDEIDKAEDTDW